jgi:Na+-driven multidrug efflux pump
LEPELEATPTTKPPQQTDWPALILVSLTFLWLVGAALTVHWLGWLVDQVIQSIGESWPTWIWFAISLGFGIILLLPFILVPFAWKNQRYRGVFQSWLLGVAYVFLLAPVHLVNPTAW